MSAASAAAGAEAVQVSLVLPIAGPSAGGSLLNVSGQGFAFLPLAFWRWPLRTVLPLRWVFRRCGLLGHYDGRAVRLNARRVHLRRLRHRGRANRGQDLWRVGLLPL